jgi:hypothetical protein
MSPHRGDERLPDLLDDVADLLRNQRSELEPLEIDRIKRRVMSAARPPSRKRGLLMRSRLVVFLTVGMLALGTGSAVAGIWYNFGGGFCGFLDYHTASNYEPHAPPCKQNYQYVNGKCKLGPKGHNWHFVHGTCWIPDGHGGYKWGKGDGWLWE